MSMKSECLRGRLCPLCFILSVLNPSLFRLTWKWRTGLSLNLTWPSCNLLICISFLSLYRFSTLIYKASFLIAWRYQVVLVRSNHRGDVYHKLVTQRARSVLTIGSCYFHQWHFVLKTRLLIWRTQTRLLPSLEITLSSISKNGEKGVSGPRILLLLGYDWLGPAWNKQNKENTWF